jgi:hypothetical protein
MNGASWSRLPNALDYVDTIGTVFGHLRCAVLQLQELYHIALAIGNGTTTLAWSIDQGLLFFNGCFYIPTTSTLLPDLLEVLLLGGPAHMRYLALGCHPPPTAP